MQMKSRELRRQGARKAGDREGRNGQEKETAMLMMQRKIKKLRQRRGQWREREVHL